MATTTITYTKDGKKKAKYRDGRLVRRYESGKGVSRTLKKNSQGDFVEVGPNRVIGPTPEAKAIKVAEQIKTNLANKFARANLRGDIRKKNGRFIPVTNAGRNVLSQVVSVNKNIKTASVPVGPNQKVGLYANIDTGEVFSGQTTNVKKYKRTDLVIDENSLKDFTKFSNVKKQEKLGITTKREYEKAYRAQFNNKEWALLQSILKNERLKNQLINDRENLYKLYGLSVKQGDNLIKKVAKGAGQLGVDLYTAGTQLTVAGNNALLTLRALAQKNFRPSTINEIKASARKTPKAVWNSFNPTKPENWANILLIGLGLKRAKSGRALNEKITPKQASRLKLPKNSRIYNKVVKPDSVKSLAGKVVKNEVKIAKNKLNKKIVSINKNLSKIATNTRGVKSAKRLIRSMRKKLRTAKTSKEIARLTFRLNKNKLLKRLSRTKKAVKSKTKKAVKTGKRKVKVAITKSRPVRIGKRTIRLSKQFKNRVTTLSLQKLQSLKITLKAKIKTAKTVVAKAKLRAELKYLKQVIKLKKKVLQVRKKVNILENDFNKFKGTKKRQFKNLKKKGEKTITMARLTRSIKRNFRKVRKILRSALQLKTKVNTLTLQKIQDLIFKVSEALKPLQKSIKSFKARLKSTSKSLKTTGRIAGASLRGRKARAIRKLKGRVRQKAQPVKAKARRVIRKTVKKGKRKVKVAIQKSKPVRISKRSFRRLRLSARNIKANIKTALLRRLRTRGVKVSIDKPKTSIYKKPLPKVFSKKGASIALNKGDNRAYITIADNGAVSVYTDIPIKSTGGVVSLQRVKIKSYSPPQTKPLTTVSNFNSFISRITPAVIKAFRVGIKPSVSNLNRLGKGTKRSTKPAIKTSRKTGQKPKQSQKRIQRNKLTQSLATTAIKAQLTKARPVLTRKLLTRIKKVLPKVAKAKPRTNKQKEELITYIKKVPPRYRPGLASVIFNITSYKIPKRFTGFEVRPIIIKR